MTKRLTLSPLFPGLILVAFAGCSSQAPEDGSSQARSDGDDPTTSEPAGDIEDCVLEWEQCWDDTGLPEDGSWDEEPTQCDYAFEECITTIDTTECDDELDVCLDEGGSDDACWFDYDECLFGDYDSPGEPTEPWGQEEECFYLFDDCLYLGVSEATCEQVLDECFEAIGDHGDCPDDGDDWDDEWTDDPCIEDFEQCLDDGGSVTECEEQLLACDDGVVIF